MQLSALLVVFSEVKVSAVPDCCITGHKNFVFFFSNFETVITWIRL